MKLLQVPPRDPRLPWWQDRAAALRRYALLFLATVAGLLVLDRYGIGPARYSHLREAMGWGEALARVPGNAAVVGGLLVLAFAVYARAARR